MYGIGRCGPEPRQFHRSEAPVARAKMRSVTEGSSLTFTVHTAQGDTVELSLAAQSVSQTGRVWAKTPDGTASERTRSSEQNFSASLKVTGDLNDEEIADIRELLSSLASGQPAADDSADTISDFSYSFQQFREVSKSNVAIYA